MEKIPNNHRLGCIPNPFLNNGISTANLENWWFFSPDFWLPSTTYGDPPTVGNLLVDPSSTKNAIHLRLFQAVATSRHVLMPKTRLSDRRGWTVGAWVGGLWVELRRKKHNFTKSYSLESAGVVYFGEFGVEWFFEAEDVFCCFFSVKVDLFF